MGFLTARVAVLMCVGALLMTACDGSSETIVAPSPEPTEPRPLPSPTARLEISDPDETGRYPIYAVSALVEVGVPYRFTLLTRCGLDLYVDFNGTLWEAVDETGNRKEGPPPGFDTPRDDGVMTLVNQELAEYVSSAGETVRYIRDPGRKRIKPCPATG